MSGQVTTRPTSTSALSCVAPYFPLLLKAKAQLKSPSPWLLDPCSTVTLGLPLSAFDRATSAEGGAEAVDGCHSGASSTTRWHILLSHSQPRGTDVIFFMNTTVLSPVAARKAMNFKNRSGS